jgi:hypothetical protein
VEGKAYLREDGGEPTLRAPEILASGRLLELLSGSGLVEELTRVAALPYLARPPIVYPDASPKPFGFPSGVALLTLPNWFYPLAAPDLGCGYEVIDTGIDLAWNDVTEERLITLLTDIDRLVSSRSAIAEHVRGGARSVLERGVDALNPPRLFSRKPWDISGSQSWEPRVDLMTDADADHASRLLGAAAGHFVAIYRVASSVSTLSLAEGRLILVVHTGSAPIRDALNRRGLFLFMAEQSVGSGASTPAQARDGMFAQSAHTDLGRSYLGLTVACRNYGYANRQIVADRVLELLFHHFGGLKTSEAIELQHQDHVAFELFQGAIRARRGIQPLNANEVVFITGGAFTEAYLCQPGAQDPRHGGLCPHGAPVYRSGRAAADLNSTSAGRRVFRLPVTNCSFAPEAHRADLENLDALMTHLADSDWVRPAITLEPFLNYRDGEAFFPTP